MYVQDVRSNVPNEIVTDETDTVNKDARILYNRRKGGVRMNNKNSVNSLEKRKLTPEEGAKMLREAEEAAERYRQYMKQREAMEKQKKETK